MSEQYWGACQTLPGREHIIRAEIEKGNRGAFLPTFAKTWVSDGKVSARECPSMPGYVLFRTDAHGWSEVGCIEGVQQVLTSEGTDERRVAKRISDAEMAILVLGHATGQHNRIGASLTTRSKERSRRRRPRPGKRIRKATVGNSTNIIGEAV